MMCSANVKRILTIDQGNSSAKGVLWEGPEIIDTVRMDGSAIEDLLPLLERGEADGCAYCSVRHTDAKFLESLRRLVDGRLLVLTASVALPVNVNYGSRSTLGNDRVAAAVGASELCPGEAALVVDAGTAMTLDVIDEEGNFMGGNIAPGMRLRFKCLRTETDQLPLVDCDGPVSVFGHDTVSAIRAGVAGGMACEIADSFRMAGQMYGCRRIILTGSDGERLLPLLVHRGLPVEKDVNLVGRGLMRIFNYNVAREQAFD